MVTETIESSLTNRSNKGWRDGEAREEGLVEEGDGNHCRGRGRAESRGLG